ncbi:hypothetical protein ACFVWR_03050 [Leifsonia sp. NPDC058292]|uniref:hypothetical protein n=1 Tax=Leifsonia sp. NPDC058292 TaxID=3346428 RepID=UPI0036DB28B8
MPINESKSGKDPFGEAVRTGPFSWIYWLLILAATVAVVVGIFGDTQQRIVTGAVVFTVIVVLTIVRYIIAAKIRRR